VVKNPEPVANKQWGSGESNTAHLLVMFGFTNVRTASAAP
jgi:hypothetical protein